MSDVTVSKTSEGNYKLSFKEVDWPNAYWEYIVKFNRFENNLFIYDQVSKLNAFDPDLSSGKGYTLPGLLTPIKLSEVAKGNKAKIKMNILNLVDMELYSITFDCR